MESSTVNIHEAKTHLSQLIERVQEGEDITIAKAGKPQAKLIGLNRGRNQAVKLGTFRGKVHVLEGFDDIPEEFEPYL